MQHPNRFLWVLVLSLICLAVAPTAAQGERRAGGAVNRGDSNTAAALRTAVSETGEIRLIAVLNVEQAGRAAFRALSPLEQQGVITLAQEGLLAELGLSGSRETANVIRYSHLPLLALTADSDQLEILLRSSYVAAIQRDEWRAPSLGTPTTPGTTTLIGMAGANGAWARGADGAGQTVAVLDSGVENTHSLLFGKVVSEACYGVTTSGQYNNANFTANPSCPGGADSTLPGSGVPCVFNAQSVANKNQCDHGTNVAGVIAAESAASLNGVAKGASLISIQVFSMINTPGSLAGTGCDNTVTPSVIENQCILAADSSILLGLDRVYQLRETFDIPAVNMSLGSGIYTSQAACDADLPAYKAIVAQLNSVGIAVVASSGNNGRPDGINAPACITGVISVGGSTDTDVIYTQSNASNFLTFVAPSVQIDTTDPGGSFDTVSGTSFASAHVTGALAAIRSYKNDVTIDVMRNALTNSGVDVAELAVPGRFYQRIQVDAALNLLVFPEKPSLFLPRNNAAYATSMITFEWSSGSDTDNYRLSVYRPDNTRLGGAVLDHVDCDDETERCTVNLSLAWVDNTTYTWEVAARNGGNLTLSNRRSFSFDTPGRPELTAPADGVEINKPSDLARIEWVEVDLATRYRVRVLRADNRQTVIFDQSVAEVDACVGEACGVDISPASQALLADNVTYVWFVTAFDDGTGSSKSTERTFFAQFPAAPTLISPIGGTIVTSPSTPLVWSLVDDAADYRLRVFNVATGQRIIQRVLVPGAGLVCDASTCSYPFSPEDQALLNNNTTYRWEVMSRNALGTTRSARQTFVIQTPARPNLVAPATDSVFHDPSQASFSWQDVGSAEGVTYKLIIRNLTTFERIIQNNIGAAACSGGTCTYDLSPAQEAVLTNAGSYRWWVVARNTIGISRTVKLDFATSYPGKPRLLTPTDNQKLTSASQLTTLTWQPAPGAAFVPVSYRVRLFRADNPSIVLLNVVVSPGAGVACDASVCTYTVEQATRDQLRIGRDYRWRVDAISGAGTSRSAVFRLRLRAQ
jgi:subtilisin family serine protease